MTSSRKASVAASVAAPASVSAPVSAPGSRRVSIAPTVDVPSVTEYENRAVLDAIENDEEYVMTQIDEEETVASYDEKVERKKLREAEKAKATVADIYPWIEQEAEPKRKVTTLAQLVKESKRKGLSQRHNLIIDLTEEIRQLRAEVEDILFYDNNDTLQDVLDELWVEHQYLIQRFEEFMSDLTVDSPPPSSIYSFETQRTTPEPLRRARPLRRFEQRIKDFFATEPFNEKAEYKAFNKKCKESKFEY